LVFVCGTLAQTSILEKEDKLYFLAGSTFSDNFRLVMDSAFVGEKFLTSRIVSNMSPFINDVTHARICQMREHKPQKRNIC